MPSNHVYQAIVDTYGYAWIGTAKGVLKYNGYTFKKFGEEEGLAKEDVWQIIEDGNNRIWLGSITPNFGYIYNNKFVSVLSNGANFVYPRLMTKVNSGFAFYWFGARRLSNKDDIDLIGQFFNGRLRKVELRRSATEEPLMTIDEQGAIYELRKNAVFKIISEEGKVVNEKICNTERPFSLVDSPKYKGYNTSRYFVMYFVSRSSFYFIDIHTGKIQKYYEKLMPLESWLTVRVIGDDIHMATSRRVFVLNKNIQTKQVYYLKDMMPVADTAEASFIWFLKDRFWHGFSTTENLGVYQHFSQYPLKRLSVGQMNGAVYIGKGVKTATHFWWNEGTKELTGVTANNKVIRNVYDSLYNARYLKDFGGVNYLSSTYGLFVLNENDGSITNHISKFKYCLDSSISIGSKVVPIRKSRFWSGYSAVNLLYKYKDTLYIKGNKFSMYENYSVGDTFVGTSAYRDQSDNNTLDTTHKILYSVFADRLLLDNLLTDKRDSISMRTLQNLGINGIREIEYDHRNGNLFLLAKDRLLLWNASKRSLQMLPLRINTIGCNMEFWGDNLVLNSPHGVVVYKVNTDGVVSKPYYIVNHKYVNYKYLTGNSFFVGDSTIVFNTDKGLMSVAIPPDSAFVNNTTAPHFRLIVNYKDSTFRLHNNDTLVVDQQNPLLDLDVINPTGVGVPRFSYNTKGSTDAWVALNGVEWFVKDLKPGVYNKVYLKVTDEGWNSPAVMVWIYITPYWWQTLPGKLGIGAVLLMLISGVGFFVMQITRRQVNKANARKSLEAELKSLRTSMELKSIHAQINPHFIFNTLSTGLYFIKKNKMDDAYDHISAFSQLLRNYIKSSRDKYITLEEEIDNLKRYVSLQQTRFENLHEFDVEIEDGINIYTEKIPALLLQPLVENAINHGLFHKSTPGRLLLRFERGTEDELVCIIDDDGVGRERAKEINAETRHKTQSYGTDLVKELIETFNKYEPIQITIKYIDKVPPQTGTTVVLTIKQLPDDKQV